MNTTLTPRQHAEARSATRPPQQRIREYQSLITYLEALDYENAPVLTIDADPDGGLEPVHLTLTGPAFLDRFKACAVEALHQMVKETTQELSTAELLASYPTTTLEPVSGITVTIVHAGPPLAHHEDDVVLD